MFIPLAPLIGGLIWWTGQKAVPAIWKEHTDKCPPVLLLPDDMPQWKQDIYKAQCVKTLHPSPPAKALP